MKYADIRNDLKTGDIVLFSGTGFISAGIKMASKSIWSHVGMVLDLPEYNFKALWESTTLSKIKNLGTGTHMKGVQLVPLSERFKTYDGKAAVRHLKGVHLDPEKIQDLMEFRKEIAGRPYEEDKLELIKSAYDGIFGGNTEDLSSLFCSEMVAEAYQRMNLLSEDLPSNEYTPADFSEKFPLELLEGHLGEEIFIEQ